MAASPPPAAGGALIAFGAIIGTGIGLALGEVTMGFLGGIALGAVGAIAVWWRSR